MNSQTTDRSKATIVWFRSDLRLRDNPALGAAIERRSPIVPLFVWAPEEEGDWRRGTASRWWLRRSLESLDGELRGLGAGLQLIPGPTTDGIERIVRRWGANAVVWNRRYEPFAIAQEKRVAEHLASIGIETASFEGTRLLSRPILNRAGLEFKRFTPYYKAFLAAGRVDPPLDAPQSIRAIAATRTPLDPGLLRAIGGREDHASPKLTARWRPGSKRAAVLLDQFVDERIGSYPDGHDRMDRAGTSELSGHLHFGEVSAREVWHRISGRVPSDGARAFLRQLVWRDFACDQLIQFPNMTDTPLDRAFESLPTHVDDVAFEAWTTGRTGYPIVDAGMRELLASGWMHNRARMVTASFLIKHLGIPWQLGAQWFWDHLVDADLGNNSMNWQWVAGSGIDRSPYYRIFNPTRQGERFDPNGHYVRRWVPELAPLPGNIIHKPWTADTPPPNYPLPIIEHEAARRVALENYGVVRQFRADGSPSKAKRNPWDHKPR